MQRPIVAALIAVALLLTASQQAAAQAMDPGTLQSRSGADFDLYFMRNIITNHQIDVELLRPAAANARHSEIKGLALSLMDKRQREADTLIGWLNDWYHNQPDTSMTATLIHMKAMPSMDMGSLNEGLHQIYDLQAANGDAYDRQALLYLIHDHQLAIAAAQLVPTRAARPELKPFAQSLIGEEQAEIDQFTAWLGQWYQVDATGKPLAPLPTFSPSLSPPLVPTPTASVSLVQQPRGGVSAPIPSPPPNPPAAGLLILAGVAVVTLIVAAALVAQRRRRSADNIS